MSGSYRCPYCGSMNVTPSAIDKDVWECTSCEEVGYYEEFMVVAKEVPHRKCFDDEELDFLKMHGKKFNKHRRVNKSIKNEYEDES